MTISRNNLFSLCYITQCDIDQDEMYINPIFAIYAYLLTYPNRRKLVQVNFKPEFSTIYV